MMILLSLPVKSHMYDILLLVYQDAATQEFLFQFHRKDLIFLIRLSPIYTRSKASFNVRTNLFTPFLIFQNLNKYNILFTFFYWTKYSTLWKSLASSTISSFIYISLTFLLLLLRFQLQLLQFCLIILLHLLCIS